MPVTKTTSITYQVEAVTVSADGAITVLVSAAGSDGQRLQSIQAQFDPSVTAPVWAAVPPAGTPRWPDLRAQLYALLQAQGYIPT
jgi:hypothetical protein